MDIIDKFVFRIADFSVENNPNSPSREVLIFVFRLLFNALLTIIITLLVCTFTGHLYEAMIVVLSTISFKIFSGSLHFKSILLCILFSSLAMIFLAHIELSGKGFLLPFSLITIILLFFYSPKNIIVFLKLNPKQILRLKWVAIVMVLINCYFQISLVTITFLFQAISITPLFEKLFILMERRSAK